MTLGPPPLDRYNAVWLIFFILGLGTLLPWNFFITATMYFTSRLADVPDRIATNSSNSTTVASPNNLQRKFNNVMTLCSMLPLLVFTCLNSFLHQRIPQKLRIMGSLIAIFLVFALTAAFVKIFFQPTTFFTVTMIKIVLINSFGAIFQGSLFGVAGILPVRYTTPIMSGQGLAGTFAAFSLICAISSGMSLEDSALGYFIVACLAILLAIGSYILLPRMDFYRYYSEVYTRELTTNAEREAMMELTRRGNVNGVQQPGKQSVIAIFKKIWNFALMVCLVFAVTIGIFPAVTADVKSSIAGTSKWNLYFIPVSCFLVFNLLDWGGRSLTALTMWPWQDSKILPLLVLTRLIFIPLFMLCNVQPRTYLPVLFAHDAYYIIFMMVFAFSNGYLATLCMSFGPKKVLPHEAETAGSIMVFFLSLGLALGAAISFLFRILV